MNFEEVEDMECLDCGTKKGVEMHWPGYGYKSYPRCNICAESRLKRKEINKERYFNPKGYDYYDAGEHWSEDEY